MNHRDLWANHGGGGQDRSKSNRASIRRRLIWLAITVGSIMAAAMPAIPALAQNVAIVTDVSGRITGQTPVTILSDISANTRLQLESGSKLVTIYLTSGTEYSFAGPAQILFQSNEPQVLNGAKPQIKASALDKGRALQVKPAHIAQAAFVMRSTRPTAHIKLLSPAGTRTLSSSPEFRWHEFEPGLTYRFELTDETGKVLYSAEAAINSLTLPSSMQLRDGASYTWEVSTKTSDGRRYVSTGDFSVATATLRSDVETFRPSPSATVSERVMYAAWLSQQDLRDEAKKVWRTLTVERSDDSQLKKLAADSN